MRPRNNPPRTPTAFLGRSGLLALALAACLLGPAVSGAGQSKGDFRVKVDVDLVVLHASVVDKHGRQVTELPQEQFTVYEDDVKQELAVFRNEDVPVTVGLVLDNSASMAEKRSEMMAGALTFVESSNPLDETFVVNFNDNAFLDLKEKDFTNEIEDLKEALEETRTRGSTAFHDAIRASLDHLRKGTRQKKVLLVITDGVDNVSVSDFTTVLREAREAEAAIYIVALPCDDDKGSCRQAKREMRKLSQVTGGRAYFPKSIRQVEALCHQVAHEIRNQYVLGYYPTNRARDGTFRSVRVEVEPPNGYDELHVRTRPGYYAEEGQRAGSQ